MIRKLLCNIILLADNHPTLFEKAKYALIAISTFGPIAYILRGMSEWFHVNLRFVSFVILAIVINIIVGWWYHHKMKTFDWELFFIRNAKMIAILVLAYTSLEMIAITAGDNMLANGFKSVIQVATLLYPLSKILKNLYILSNKQFPPTFIMERLYNFDKTGNLEDLFPKQPKGEISE